jgi:putative transposase
VFEEARTKEAFEACLWDACERFNWVLHAHVVMGNHFHLAVETPEGNLSAGMHWLQSTFSTRFNRMRSECGHVFQGRFKALLVDPSDGGLVRLCHYINLNPCRAGLCSVDELRHYRYSSFWYLYKPDSRKDFMLPQTALQGSGALADNSAGWDSYAEYLSLQFQSGSVGRGDAYESLSTGWAIGSQTFQVSLLKSQKAAALTRTWDAKGARQARELAWDLALNQCLSKLTGADMESKIKSALWRVAVAAWMKKNTSVSNGWLAKHLQMGSPAYLSRLIGDPKYISNEVKGLWGRMNVKCEA